MKKRLSKTVWYGSEVDTEGNPVVPRLSEGADDLEGLHHGELYLHEADDNLSLWARTSTNQVKPIGGLGGGGSFWKLMETENGEKYIFSDFDVVTQKGITMYVDGGMLNLPSIYDGLPIDNDTICWEEVEVKVENEETGEEEVRKIKVLKAKTVTTLGGLLNVGEWADQVPVTDRIMVKKAGSEVWEGMDIANIGTASFENIEEYGEGNAFTSFLVTEGDEGEKLYLVKDKTFVEQSYLEENYFTKDDASGLFVTLDDTVQIIQGVKFFSEGLYIGTSKIWQSQNDVVYIDANLVVRGGVTMYGLNKVDIPTIMAGVAVDDKTITKRNGYLEVIGGGGGSISYPLSWSGFSSGSYDGTEAKAIYIPSKVSEFANDSLFINLRDLVFYIEQGGYITASALSGYATESWCDSKFVTELGLAQDSSGTFNQYLTYTKNGVVNKISVGYAGYATGLKAWSTSDLSSSGVWNTVIGMRTAFFGSNASNIPTAAGSNANSLITFMPAYNYGFQIACLNSLATGYDGIPHLFFRNYVNGSYKGWYRVVTDGPQMTLQGINWDNPYMRIRYQSNEWYYIQPKSDGLWLGQSTTNGVRIDASGNIHSTGGITMYSDERKKTILNHVQLSLKEVVDAPLIEHYYNSDAEKTTHVGSIAQYWAGLNDWFCKLDSEGFYTMEIQNAALASAISVARELLKYETETDKQIRKLKKRISDLEEEVELLKKM